MIIPFGYFQDRGTVDLTSFIITVKTDNVGTSLDTQFTIPTFSASYNYDVDWGDGTTTIGRTSATPITHTYSVAGTYDIKISGSFPWIYFNNGGDKLKLIDIKQWGNIAWGAFLRSFYGCNNLTVVSATDTPDISGVTALREMFQSCTQMTYLNVVDWDTSLVTEMRETFNNCPVLDVSFASWDINHLTNFVDFLKGGELSIANYDATLIGWEAQTPLTNGLVNFGTSRYTENGAGQTAHDSLIDTYLWTITDGGAIADALPLANIISEYKFENNVLDFVGTNDGTATGITYEAGLVGQTGIFNGTTSNVDCGNALDLQRTTGTLSSLIKTSNAGAGFRCIFGKRLAYNMFLVDNVFTIYDYGSSTARSTGINLADNTWHHVSVTFNSGVTNGAKLFIDGNLALTTTMTVSAQTDNFVIGQHNNIQQFNGNIDCATIWNIELTEGEVALLAQDELNGIDINP